MDNNEFQALKKSISDARFAPYARQNRSDLEALTCYVWNIELCEAAYVPLQNLAVCLRNTLHDAIATHLRTPDWLCSSLSWLQDDQMNQVRRAKGTLRAQNRAVTSGGLVAELTFGFWSGLLSRSYEQVLWPRLVVKAFPFFPPHQRARQVLSERFTKIRHFRNRVFHHEPVWNLRDLAQQYESIMDAMSWISPQMVAVTNARENFSEVQTAEYRRDISLSLSAALQPPNSSSAS